MVELVPGGPVERLPPAEIWQPPAALELAESARPRLLRLDPFEASAPAKVAAATAAVIHNLLRETVAAP